MAAPKNHLIWNMTRKCNFACEYCYFPHDHTPVETVLPADRIVDFLDSTGREWVVGMTGGEPFIYPGFLDICRELTRSHRISLDTNLSVSAKVKRFANEIDPERVYDIYAALHIAERERTGGVESFIENVLLLKERGFHIVVNYVIYPPLAERFLKDKEYFASQGVDVTPRPFKGEFRGETYPEAYGEIAKDLFEGHKRAGRKMVHNFHGVLCEGGRTFIRMEPDGTVFRCTGDHTVMGNILTGVKLLEKPEPCRVPRCPCLGPNYVRMTPEQEQVMEGITQFMVGDLAAARASLEQALASGMELPNAVNNLAVISWREGDVARAVELIAQAVQQAPENGLYAANQAVLLDRSGNGEEARALCAVDRSFATGKAHYRKVCSRLADGETLEPEVTPAIAPDAPLYEKKKKLRV